MLLQTPNPSTICISGTSGSGKSSLVHKIIQNIDSFYCNPTPCRIMYCYGQYQNLFSKIEAECSIIQFHPGLPSEKQLQDLSDNNVANGTSSLLILDDLQELLINSPLIQNLFTVKSHHSLINVIYLKQNLFCPGKYSRTISLNTHIYLLTSNMRDLRQISLLGSQIYGKDNCLLTAYKDAMLTPFNYLVIDLHPKSCEEYRLRTNIFNDAIVIYQKV